MWNTETYLHTLTSGKQFLIDLEDKHFLNKYTLGILKNPLRYTEYVRLKDLTTRKYAGLLHRVIMNTPNDVMIDHINGNGLDCTKINLRISNSSFNQMNRRISKIENEVKGLYYRKDRGYWTANITLNGKQIVLGSFHDKDDAIEARLNAEQFYFGEYNGLGTSQ